MDLPRIELRPYPSQGYVLPLNYRATDSDDLPIQVRVKEHHTARADVALLHRRCLADLVGRYHVEEEATTTELLEPVVRILLVDVVMTTLTWEGMRHDDALAFHERIHVVVHIALLNVLEELT